MVLLNGDDANCVEVAQECLAPIVEVGLSENCAQRIRHVSYGPKGSSFMLGDESFEIPLIGEFNVRNAAMAVTAAGFYHVSNSEIRDALKDFAGIARRQEVRGEARGVKVIDDFAHHPTAIAQTPAGLAAPLSRPTTLGHFRDPVPIRPAGPFFRNSCRTR